MTTILLSIFALSGLIFAGYATYKRQQTRNRHKQTRVVLRDTFQTEDERNRKFIEDSRYCFEYDVNEYKGEDWR
jgi:hypothetical protein